MDSVILETFRASFNTDGPVDRAIIGTPITVIVPSSTGEGSSQATGVVVEIHDGYIVAEFIA